jgi:cytochrome P450
VAGRDRYQYLPFGAGPRVCVGANFAMMQAQIILATLLARFELTPAGPAPMPVMHMTVRPDPGVLLFARPADDHRRAAPVMVNAAAPHDRA